MTSQPVADQPSYRRLGRIASLGPREPWQVALLLPDHHDNLVDPIEDARKLEAKEPRAIRLHLASTPRASFGSGRPKVTFGVRDHVGGEYRATIFGDTREWLEILQDVSYAHFLATAKEWNGDLYLTIQELVEDEWVGRMRPRYPARRQQITPSDARATVLKLLPEAIPRAAEFWRKQLGQLAPLEELLADVGACGWTLEQLLLQAHVPETAAHGEYARMVCRRLAALGSLLRMHGIVERRQSNVIDMSSVDARIAQLPWTPTNDQHKAIAEIARRIGTKGPPSHVCLAGDVGVGKTLVAAVACAAIADAPGGRRALVLSPNTLLAEQLHREFTGFFPDIPMRLVTGDTPTSADLQVPILIGTSALLHRSTGETPFDLVIIDEQHRWSRAQREQHVGPGTHLLELSATPIPRTQALMRYGRVAVVEMRDTPRPKTFITTIYEGREGARSLFDTVTPSVRSGDVLLVVYPKREASSEEDPQGELVEGGARRAAPIPAGGIDDRHSIERAKARWEAAFPGRVATLTSDDDDVAKAEVLQQICTRQVQVLLCTTVVEVGINLPNLYRIVIVCPERHGLMALHQLRGRTARNGGEGYCDLLCPEPLSDEQREKLQTFANTSDGFALAEYDMRRRGAGDLAPDSDRQSGSDNTFLFGTKLDVECLDQVAEVWRRWTDPLLQE